MASIQIAIWVDSDGNARVEADDELAYNNLDDSLAVRRVVLNVEVPEPQAEQEIEVDVPAEEPVGDARVKWVPPVSPDEPVAAGEVISPSTVAPSPVAKLGWLGR